MVRGGHERGPGGQVVAVAGATTLPSVAVDGRLQLAGVAQLQLVALVGVQVLHVPGRQKGDREVSGNDEEEDGGFMGLLIFSWSHS